LLSIDETIQLIRIGEPPASTDPSLPASTSVCSTALADAPQQGFLPQEYRQAPKSEFDRRIREAKAALGDRALVEASGGITLARIHEVAETGVDLISVGALTHSVRSLDLGLDIQAQ